MPAPLSADELVHPFLAPAAALFAHWHGREGLHGGALALGGTAWGVIGDRLGGKSSLLAALAVSGTDVVCDDVLVLDGREVYPGPRTVDLREDAAAALERRRGDRCRRSSRTLAAADWSRSIGR